MSFFTLAIIIKNNLVINDLINQYPLELNPKYDWDLEPLNAALQVKDYQTIVKLLTNGVPTNYFNLAYSLATIDITQLQTLFSIDEFYSS